MSVLEAHTRGVRDAGRKLLVAYVTGGVTEDWTDHVRAAVDAGADVVEIGLPFSDPMVDGPVVQEASDRALTRGSTVDGLLDEAARLDVGVPLVVMTYANPVLRRGARGFRAALAGAGISGLIVPDMPVDHIDNLSGDDVDLILLASPATPADRRAEIARRSRGFVYAVSLMGTTGARLDGAGSGAGQVLGSGGGPALGSGGGPVLGSGGGRALGSARGGREVLPEAAAALVRDLKAATDLPVLLGFGVATPADAAGAAACADGVIVGSALVRRVLDGATPAQTGAFLQRLRAAVDGHVEVPDALADQGATGAEVRHDRRRSRAAYS